MLMLKNEKATDYLLIGVLGIVLFAFYCSNIKNITTVWELGDEAGYLMNAAYMSGTDWSELSSRFTAYFGYGYSIILIPCFLLAKTGEQLIQGAVFVNILCVLVAYSIQVYLLPNILNGISRKMAAGIAFVVSFYPYLVANTNKVLCETFLTTWFWLITLLFYLVIKKGKLFYYIVLAFASAYFYVIHTRGIIAVGVLCFMLCVYMVRNKKWKHLVVFLVMLGAALLVGMQYKNILINAVYGKAGMSTDGTEETAMANIITVSYILNMLQGLFNLENLKLYIIAFVGKNFYLVTSTCGMYAVAVFVICRDCLGNWKRKNSFGAAEWVQLFLLLAMMAMLAACAINGGTTYLSDWRYCYYSRYYEQLLPPLIAVGLYGCIQKHISVKSICIGIALTIGSGLVCWCLQRDLISPSIRVDTARVPGWSYVLDCVETYSELIAYLVLYGVLIGAIIAILVRLRRGRVFVLVLVMIAFLVTDKTVINKINKASTDAYADNELIEEYLKDAEKNIYFADGEFRYNGYYARLQVLLYDIPLHIIDEDDIDDIYELEKDTYIFAYSGSTQEEILSSDERFSYVATGSSWQLYQKKQ